MSWTAIYDRDFIKKNNIMFEKEIIFEDDLFYVKALMTATRVSSVNDCYYGYMRRDNSITNQLIIYKRRYGLYVKSWLKHMNI